MRSAIGVAFGFLALHLVAGALIPLIGDEAYYTLWATRLDWDYYDHPPMIAGMIHLGVALFGQSPFGIRVVALLAMGCASLLVADVARLMGLRPVLAVVYFNLSLLVAGVGGFATPDAPSTLFWLLSSWAALKATEGQGVRWWLLAGLAAGLGIMSKFTNLFLGVGYVGWLMFTARGRASLRGLGPYLAVVAAVLPVVPLIWWNLTHDMLGLERQFGRISGGTLTARHLVEYLALLILLPSPVIGVLALRGVWRPFLGRGLLLWSVAPLLAYFGVHALHAQVQANWLIPVAAGVALLAAAAGRWQRPAVAVGAVFSFGLLAVALNPWVPIGTTDNPPNQTRGWPAALAQMSGAMEGAEWVATTEYMATGQLFVGLDLPVHAVTDVQRYGFRGLFPKGLCDAPGVLVEVTKGDATRGAELFAEIGEPVRVERRQAGVVLQSYALRRVRGVTNPALCPR